MSNNKQKLPRITTPVGIAKYPHLNKPDTRFNEAGVYRLSVVFNENDPGVKEFKESLLKLQQDAKAEATASKKPGRPLKASGSVIKPVFEDEVEVGEVFEVSFKTSAVSQNGTPRRMALFDAALKPTNKNVGSGSKVKVAFSPSIYNTPSVGYGVVLYLNAVQVIELVEFAGGSGEGFGFAKEEGFVDNQDEATEAAEEGAQPDAPPAGKASGDF